MRSRWNPGESTTCPLCSRESKDCSHLVFQSPFAQEAWGLEGSSGMDSGVLLGLHLAQSIPLRSRVAKTLCTSLGYLASQKRGYLPGPPTLSHGYHIQCPSICQCLALLALAIPPLYFIIICSSNGMGAPFLCDPLFLFKFYFFIMGHYFFKSQYQSLLL